MNNAFMMKLMQVCCFADETTRYLENGWIKEGSEDENKRIMRLRYMEAIIDLARERFARNFAKAIEGAANTEILKSPNFPGKYYRIKAYLEKNGMVIKPFMFEAMVQASIIYELGGYGKLYFEVYELKGAIYIPFTPDWALYGMEELFWRYTTDNFIDVSYFDGIEWLTVDYKLPYADKDSIWNQFSIYILGMLAGGECFMPVPEYNHELDRYKKNEDLVPDGVSSESSSKERPNTPIDSLNRLKNAIVNRLKEGIKL